MVFADPNTGAMCLRVVEMQRFDDDVNQGNYLEDPMMAAVAYGNNMQNLVRGCEHEAMSSAVNPINNIVTNKDVGADIVSDDSTNSTSLFDLAFGDEYYPVLIDSGMQSGSRRASDHNQTILETHHRWFDYYRNEHTGSEGCRATYH